jgi:hypothetical protein
LIWGDGGDWVEGSGNNDLVDRFFFSMCRKEPGLVSPNLNELFSIDDHPQQLRNADDQQQPRVDDIVRGNVPPNLEDVVGFDDHQQQPRDVDNVYVDGYEHDTTGLGGMADVLNEHQCGNPPLVFATR